MANRKNKVKFGLKNCHYALVSIDDEGAVTFGSPVRLPGSVSLPLMQRATTIRSMRTIPFITCARPTTAIPRILNWLSCRRIS